MSDFAAKPDVELGGTYQHYNNGQSYEVTDLSYDKNTHEWRITYKPLYETPPTEPEKYNLPLGQFFEEVAINGIRRKRFERI